MTLVTSGVTAATGDEGNVVDYAQCANGAPGSSGDSTDCDPKGWIFGILNANNSQYAEDQVTAQRLILELPAGGPTQDRTIVLKWLVRKANNHAYDSLATWDWTQANAEPCDDLSGPVATQCNLDYPTDLASFPIPDDPAQVGPNSGVGAPSTATSFHQLDGQQLEMYGLGAGGDIDSMVYGGVVDESGDLYQSATITYHVDSLAADRQVMLLFGGHLAAGGGARSWGAGNGASDINGGPYHIKLIQVDGASIGNRDNQIMSSAILPLTVTLSTVLHQTDAAGTDVSPANNGTTISAALPANGSGVYVKDVATASSADATGNVTFFYYSSLTACEANTGGTQVGGIVALAGGSATSAVRQFTTAGTYYWKAYLDGTGITQDVSSPCNEILTLSQNTSTSTTLHQTDSSGADVSPANNGTTISAALPANGSGIYVTDYASLTPSGATGSVAFRYYGSESACTADTTGTGGTAAGGGTVSSGSATSSTVQFTTAGTYYWKAFFTGTGSFNNSASPCNEILTLSQNTSTSTTLHQTDSSGADVSPANNGTSITVLIGSYVTDYASLTPSGATGSVAFRYYGSESACTADTTGTGGTAAGGGTVSSGSATSSTVQFTTAGTYYWKAFFTGTGSFNNSASPCNEILTVSKVTPTLTTAPRLYPQDYATLSGILTGGSGSMTLTFQLYQPTNATCSGDPWFQQQVDVSGNGTYNTTNITHYLTSASDTGVYRWKVLFNGDSYNNAVTSACGVESFNFGGITNDPAPTP